MNQFFTFKWLAASWCRMSSFLGRNNSTYRKEEGTTSDAMQVLESLLQQHYEKEAHLEAARAVSGPQTWDHDWYETQQDLSSEYFALAQKAGWHRLQEFLEIITWALSSPQCQEALMVNSNPRDHKSGALKLIGEIYPPLRYATHEMLRANARSLRYPREWMEDLESALQRLHSSAVK